MLYVYNAVMGMHFRTLILWTVSLQNIMILWLPMGAHVHGDVMMNDHNVVLTRLNTIEI